MWPPWGWCSAELRRQPDRIDIVDRDAALAYCKENLPSLVITREDLSKTELKKAVFDGGLGISFSGTVNTYEDEVGLILEDIYDISIIPQKPADLKSKKINLKSFKISDLESKSNEELFETIEDCLYDSGLLDID